MDVGPGLVCIALPAAAGVYGEEISAESSPPALVMSLALSGLPVHSFCFRGFPLRKSGPRPRFLYVGQDSPHTLIFYEARTACHRQQPGQEI